VARTGAIEGLGLDLEPALPLPADLRDRIGLPEELQASGAGMLVERDLLATVVFSAKESIFKALNPLTGLELDFLDVVVSVRPGDDSFDVRFATAEASAPAPELLHGRYAVSETHIATGVTLQRHRGS
jgi:4'-phosphopantetheinyl transferase EntD